MPDLATKAKDQVAQSDQPLVSICIPTFNGARWIRECLDSALAQSYQPMEIVVVDDASTDGTIEQVRSLKDERIRIVANKALLSTGHNEGTPGAESRESGNGVEGAHP